MANRQPRTPGRKPAGQDDLKQLGEAVTAAAQLLPVLANLLPEQSGNGPPTGTIGRHPPESSEPWQDEAAHAYWTIWFGARKTADRLRQLNGLPAREWGAGDTSRALGLILSLAVNISPDDLEATLARVEGWVAQARRIRDIDEVDSWSPVPRLPGSQPPACPYCKTLSLRMSRLREEVRCFFPGCQDLDGNPTRARMERGLLSDGGLLVFGDGTVVAFVAGVAYGETDPTGGAP